MLFKYISQIQHEVRFFVSPSPTFFYLSPFGVSKIWQTFIYQITPNSQPFSSLKKQFGYLAVLVQFRKYDKLCNCLYIPNDPKLNTLGTFFGIPKHIVACWPFFVRFCPVFEFKGHVLFQKSIQKVFGLNKTSFLVF